MTGEDFAPQEQEPVNKPIEPVEPTKEDEAGEVTPVVDEKVESDNAPKTTVQEVPEAGKVEENAAETAANTENTAISDKSKVNNIAENQTENSEDFTAIPGNVNPNEETPNVEVAASNDESVDNGEVGDSDKAKAQYISSLPDVKNPGLKAIKDGISTIEDKPEENPVSDNVKLLTDVGAYDNPQDQAAYDEYMNGAPEATSKEEEERIIKGKQTAQGIAALGNVLSALANVFAVGNGAISQQIPELKQIDYQALRDKYRQGRDLLAKYKAGARQYVENMRIKREELEIKKQRAEAYSNYQQAKIEHDKAMEALKADVNDINREKLQLAQQKLDAAIQHWQTMEGIAQQRANTQAYQAQTSRKNYEYKVSGSGNNKFVEINTPSGTYSIKKDNIAAYRGRLMQILGMENSPVFRAKTNNEIDEYIMQNWNDECTDVMSTIATRLDQPTQPAQPVQPVPTQPVQTSPAPAATPAPAKTESEDLNAKAKKIAATGVELDLSSFTNKK